jgi:nitrate/nitrite transporter NarK
MLRQRRLAGGMICFTAFAILISSFDTTLPLHVGKAFSWGSLPAGMMFGVLQIPSVVLTPLSGWLKDRFGSCHPTWIGLACITPCMCLIGIPGDERFPWANEANRGPAIYITGIVVVGSFTSLIQGVGTAEAGGTYRSMLLRGFNLRFYLFIYFWVLWR